MGFDAMFTDPNQAAMMGLASGLLQAGGPSRMPITFGQAFANGMNNSGSAYKSAIDMQREQMAFAMQQQQLMQALRQGALMNDVYSRVLNKMGQQGTSPAAPAQQDNSSQPPQPAPALPDISGLDTSQLSPQQITFLAKQNPDAFASGVNDFQKTSQARTAAQQIPQQLPPLPPPSGVAPQGGGSVFGLPADVAAVGLMGGPGEFAKAVLAANAPTDIQKNIKAIAGDLNSPLAQQMMAMYMRHQINPLQAIKEGGGLADSSGAIVNTLPRMPEGSSPIFQNGRVVGVQSLPNAQAITAQNAAAKTAGEGSQLPVTAYNPTTGQYEYTNRTLAAGGGLPSGPGAPGQAPAKLAPQPAPGTEAAATDAAKAVVGRYAALSQAAQDSPTRANILDNILQLSQSGVKTGPTAEFNNKVKGVLTGVPGVDSMFPGLQKDLSNYQEINKFVYQNAIKNWQAAGGTGTDAQQEAAMNAFGNSKMTPEALQRITQWAKAGELALQGKANAADKFVQTQGGDPRAYAQFENAWRNAYDPVLFQLKMLEPAKQQQYLSSLKQSSPAGYQSLLNKAQALQGLGGL